MAETHSQTQPPLQSSSLEGEQDQADLGTLVYERCVGNVCLE